MIHNDIGFFLANAQCAFAPQVVTAGAGIDNVQQNGIIFDRLAVVGADIFPSTKLVFFGVTTLAAAETLTVAADVQHGDNSALSDAAVLAGFTLATTIVKTGAATAGVWTVSLDVDLRTAKRYFRCRPTFDLSRATTDTAAVAAAWILGGGSILPAV